MDFQYLDLILAAVMLISALLAVMRGFTCEVLSLVAWGVAALAAIGALLSDDLKAFAVQYIPTQVVAYIVLGAVVFLVVLIVMSLISVKLADLVLDSSVGPFDRTLAFFYGLARGLMLVVVLYLFYIWFIPREKHDDWVRKAHSLPAIESVGQFVISFLPDEIAETLQGKTYIGTQGLDGASGSQPDAADDDGYKSGQTRKLDQLIEGTQKGTQGDGQN